MAETDHTDAPAPKQRKGWPKGKPRGPRKPTEPKNPGQSFLDARDARVFGQVAKHFEKYDAPTPAPSPHWTIALHQLRVQHQVHLPGESGWQDLDWIPADRGWLIEADYVRRVVTVRHQRRQDGMSTVIPFENVASMMEASYGAPQAVPQPQAAPPVLHVVPGLGVQSVPPPWYKGPEQVQQGPQPPRDLRPTVSARDLGPQALAFFQQNGYVMVAGQQCRVVG